MYAYVWVCLCLHFAHAHAQPIGDGAPSAADAASAPGTAAGAPSGAAAEGADGADGGADGGGVQWEGLEGDAAPSPAAAAAAAGGSGGAGGGTAYRLTGILVHSGTVSGEVERDMHARAATPTCMHERLYGHTCSSTRVRRGFGLSRCRALCISGALLLIYLRPRGPCRCAHAAQAHTPRSGDTSTHHALAPTLSA